jgi:cytochrome c oxidase cbb3-type subunit 1
MNGAAPDGAVPYARVVTGYCLGWLVAANAVGLWLGVVLLWPAAGDALAPFTFGRWVPLHLNWQLYGWCALPLVGALLAWFFDPGHPRVRAHTQAAFGAWSLALLLGGVGWLGGTTSGKLFLDWHGWTRPLLPGAMHVLWALLAAHTCWRWRGLATGGRAARLAALAMLLAVPTVLHWSAGREVYPAVNPDSGGATGAALLGSTLGLVTIFLLLPAFLGVGGHRPWRTTAAALAVSWGIFAAIDHGHASHHAWGQIVGLGSLLVWAVWLPWFWLGHAWPDGVRPWLRAAIVWWVLLVASGWVTFLPGVSEAWKFTHSLVGHAHLAMAGLVTSLNAVILIVLARRPAPRGVFGWWQGGCAVFVAAMLGLGAVEAERAGELFRSEVWTQAVFALRLAGGAAMAVASFRWWRENRKA